ncbi:MAG: putative toxin-antitoxin system toxin component, PIN family [Sulfuritalea sp.]|nr:putative toxin-antitoxin system toxin component, PIN family [Sulfuritalea sp.]
MKTELAYIVIDTNVLISAGLLPQSKTAQVLALAVEHFVIAQNKDTWHELETRIARPKFDRYFGDSGRLRHLAKIAQSIQRFEVSAAVSVSRDKTDDKFIELAIDSGASILISGDPDLRVVKTFKGVEILSPAQFFERFSP